MDYSTKELISRHIRTHTIRSAEDKAAVTVLESFLRSGGRINTNFASGDKWPNIDGTFEFVSNPDLTRSPEQNFIVQIKGTHVGKEKDGKFKYSLQGLGFPAFVYDEVSADPAILFVVYNCDIRGKERVFWKYMSVDFLDSINFANNSTTITFLPSDELKNTEESIDEFCDKISKIIDHHKFIKRLDNTTEYTDNDINKLIKSCNKDIVQAIGNMTLLNETRDDISKKILNRLESLCYAILLFNAKRYNPQNLNLQIAMEKALFDRKTRYLSNFIKGLKYVSNRIPDEGQSERLMLKYYDFLWQIRKNYQRNFGCDFLHNLEEFPRRIDDAVDLEYYEMVSNVVYQTKVSTTLFSQYRFYVQKKSLFYINGERFFEYTLQLASTYATKFNRITLYSTCDIITDYSIQIRSEETSVKMWGVDVKIKVLTDWKVAIDPKSLNILGKVLRLDVKLNSKYGEYNELMNFLYKTGANLLDIIDLDKSQFNEFIDDIYRNTNTAQFKEVLTILNTKYNQNCNRMGRNVVRFLVSNLRTNVLEGVLPTTYNSKLLNTQYYELYLSSRCYPFEIKPLLFNLVGTKSINYKSLNDVLRGDQDINISIVSPYIKMKQLIARTGEIYYDLPDICSLEKIEEYNRSLSSWDKSEGVSICVENNVACIESYEKSTLYIVNKLLNMTTIGNGGQRQVNESFIKNNNLSDLDDIKVNTLRNIFVNSKLCMIYGAAGTGKTTLLNYISNLFGARRKLFLTKTHTTRQNLKRRIDNPGPNSEFVSLDSFTKKVTITDYDVIFIDECSIIDNAVMMRFLQKISSDTLLVLAGDIYQIESIDFGNWFYYIKGIIKNKYANIELLNTWRTKESNLISLWSEVRSRELLITEKLVIDGPFSENINENIFEKLEEDEVVLCLNYDGKFGLNSINNYFQNANTKSREFQWAEWSYKVGDPILFNENKRFEMLYNNLKGKIVDIYSEPNTMLFTLDVETLLTELDCRGEGLKYISTGDTSTRIQLRVTYDENNEESNLESIIPFQLAYAVSIHKSQGLEYDAVKIVIPTANAEKITHGIFYTAITRAKKKLKIYWSTETMHEVVEGFASNNLAVNSLEVIKAKLNE